MGNSRIGLIGAGFLMIGFFLGRSFGPATVDFPDRDEIRNAAEMELAVDEALRIPRAFVRTVTLVRLFEGLDSQNVEGASRAISSRSGRWDPIDLQLFLTAWVSIDPVAAIRAVENWPIRSRRELGIKITMREWAASGARLDAVDYLQTSLDPTARGMAAGPLVRGWALSGDFEGALELARRLWESEKRLDVVDGYVRGVLHVAGPAAALEIARQADPKGRGEFEQRLARVTLDLTIREDPAEAVNFYEVLIAEGVPSWLDATLGRLVEIWRNEDPEAVLVWLRGLDRNTQRDGLITKTVAQWGISDFNTAWEWFEAEHAPFDSEGLLSEADCLLLVGLLPKMARTRPVAGSEWVTRLRPGSDREAMLRRVARFWALEDSGAASRWVEGLDLLQAERAQLRRIIENSAHSG